MSATTGRSEPPSDSVAPNIHIRSGLSIGKHGGLPQKKLRVEERELILRCFVWWGPEGTLVVSLEKLFDAVSQSIVPEVGNAENPPRDLQKQTRDSFQFDSPRQIGHGEVSGRRGQNTSVGDLQDALSLKPSSPSELISDILDPDKLEFNKINLMRQPPLVCPSPGRCSPHLPHGGGGGPPVKA